MQKASNSEREKLRELEKLVKKIADRYNVSERTINRINKVRIPNLKKLKPEIFT